MVLPQPMNPHRHTTRGEDGWAPEGVRCEKVCCKTCASDYSRLEILIVPLNEESSTRACPALVHRADQAASHARRRRRPHGACPVTTGA